MNKHPVCNERFDDETYAEYRARLRRVQRKMKARLRGMLFYNSNDRDPKTGKRVPYRKADVDEGNIKMKLGKMKRGLKNKLYWANRGRW